MRRCFSLLGLSTLRACCTARAPGRVTNNVSALICTPVMAAAQKRFVQDSALADATGRELQEELQRSGKPEQPVPPSGWTIKRTPGKSTFDMSKQYEDEEILLSYCPKEDSGDVNNHEIVVMVTRNNQTMQFDLSVEDGELVLENVCFYPDAQLAKEESAEADAKRAELYPGPKVSELDDALVDSFIKYLEKRGVNEELGEFVSLYSFWTEQQEYEGWLSAINKFVA